MAVKSKPRAKTGYDARPWLKLVPRPETTDDNRVRLYMPDGTVTLDSNVTSTALRMTLDEAATLTVVVADPVGDLASLALTQSNEDRLLSGVDLRWRGVWWRIARIERGDNSWTITAEDRIAAYLRSHTREMTASRGDVTRAQFVRRLALGVRAGGGIATYIPELTEKQGIYKPAEPTGTASKARASSGSGSSWGAAGGKVKVKRVQADSGQLKALDEILTEGARLGATRRVLIACVMCATQESVLRNNRTGDSRRSDTVGYFQQGPEWVSRANTSSATMGVRAFLLGSREAKAGGTGNTKGWKQRHGSLKASSGNLNDMIKAVQISIGGYADWQEEATKTVDLWMDRNQGAVGDTADTTRTYRGTYSFRTSSDQAEPQNWWDAMGALADEVQWHRWAVANTLGYATDNEMIRGNPVITLNRETDAVHDLSWSWDYRREASELSVEIALEDPFQFLPGMVVMVDDEAPVSGRWLVDQIEVDPLAGTVADLTLRRKGSKKLEPAPEIKTRSEEETKVGGKASYNADQPGRKTGTTSITTAGGAKGIVDQAARLAASAGGSGVYVGSAFRGGSTTSSGNPSDHAGNDASRAARDIGVRGIDLLVGPPSPKLDVGVAAIGKAFERDYGSGNRLIVDTFQWRGYRIQIIWRTPAYGGHMGHIHIGARRG